MGGLKCRLGSLQKAIGDQLICIFVDHGLLRKGKATRRWRAFLVNWSSILSARERSGTFLSKPKGVSDPEQKRKIIGNEFVYVFDDEAAKLTDVDFLAQGTPLYRHHRIRNENSANHQVSPITLGTSRGHAIRTDRTAQYALQRRSAPLEQRLACQIQSYGANHSLDQDLEFRVLGDDGNFPPTLF